MAIKLPSPLPESEPNATTSTRTMITPRLTPEPASSSASASASGVSPRKAWATLVTNPSYVAGLLTLHRTLISVSSYPLVVMTTPSLPASSKRLIASRGMEIIEIASLHPPLSQHGGFDAGSGFARFEDTWTKLRVFELTQFERVILIDSDMIFLRDMDELFDMELERDWIAAAPACVCNPLKISHYPEDWIPSNCSFSLQPSPTPLLSPPLPIAAAPRVSHLLNSGLVILHPSHQLMSALTTYLETSPDIPSFHFPDQEVLAEVFRGRWRPLPWWCNALKTLRAVHPDLWVDDEVRLIHYILDKPWSSRPKSVAAHTTEPSSVLPPTPTSTTSSRSSSYFQSRRPLPSGLLESVRKSLPQQGMRNYEEVNVWWWIVYDDLMDELKAQAQAQVQGGVNLGDLKEMDAWVKR